MSLILEALKKSEQQRRLGEAPTLGSPVVATRQRRNVLPILVALIVVAGGVAWWLMRSPAPAPSNAPTAAPAQANAAKPATPPPDAARRNAAPVMSAAKNAADVTRPRVVPAPVKGRPGILGAGASAPPAAGALPKAAGTPARSAAPPAKTVAPAAQPSIANAAATAAATVKPPTPAPAPVATPTAPVKPAPTAQGANAAAQPQVPSIWELPYSTRKDIPAIDLSMHVYSPDPKQRFVVIKGDRHVEGDEVGQDLVLKAIRQDGVVLEYKGQAFFFPRNGR